jgi:carbohydrate kinase (thermoresistant glucokinase family)
MILIVAGVSGSGKTTVGSMLAGRLGWRFADADGFHPAANIAKMRAGIPLTDDDRWPWLRAIGAWMDERIRTGESAVVTCSALKRAYRDELLDGRPQAHLVFLAVDRDVVARRLTARHGHFFPRAAAGQPARCARADRSGRARGQHRPGGRSGADGRGYHRRIPARRGSRLGRRGRRLRPPRRWT